MNLKEFENKTLHLYLDDKFDSALICYKQLILLEKPNRKSYYNLMIADCYKNLGELNLAKINYLEGLTDTVDLWRPILQRNCSHGIADVFMQENDFQQALVYLKLAESKFPAYRACSALEFERKLSLGYKFAKCFDGVNEIDSAIKYMTPYMFAKTADLVIDGAEHIRIVNYYYELLKKRYNECELTTLLSSAMQHVYYKKEYDTVLNNKFPQSNYYKVKCYINFVGARVSLANGGYEANGWGGEPVIPYTKEYLLEYFRQTPAYLIIEK